MNENVEFISSFIFLTAIGVLFLLAGIFGWQEPQLFRGESWKDSRKDWVRILKMVVGVIFLVVVLVGLFDRIF